MLSEDYNNLIKFINKHESLNQTLSKIQTENKELFDKNKSLEEQLDRYKQYNRYLKKKVEQLKNLI